MPTEEKIEKAVFTVKGKKKSIPVHFNPQSLQYAISNTLKNKGKGDKKKQHVSQSTGKLTLDLIFDTTDSGKDVRLETVQIAKFMEPKRDKTPPVVNFEWGLYKFTGMVESYKETIDFFSAKGVPLRASVNLTLSAQDKVFEGGSNEKKAGTRGSPDFPNDSLPATAPPGKGATDVANKAGNPDATRAIADFNGIENLRFPGSATLEISESFPLKPPAAFASGGLGASAGLGLGLDIGGGIGASAGAGLDLQAEASVGASLSAGVSATAGAFSGLRTQSKASASSAKINVDNFLEEDATAKFGMEDSASFGIGGKAGSQGSASLKAEVGKAGDLSARLQFEDG